MRRNNKALPLDALRVTSRATLRVTLLSALLGAACVFAPAYAADAPAKAEAAGPLLQQVMQGMAQVKSSRARFVERKYLSIVNTPLEYTGGLAYTAPDRLEKNTQTPKAESMLLEGDKLTLVNAKKQARVVMLSQYPLVRAFTESIRSVLAGDLTTLNRYYKVSAEGSAAEWKLLLVPSEPTMQGVVKEIRFTGAAHSIKTIEITEKQGDRSVMTITEAGA
ncbi:MAG: putative transrane protein [Betaproteobacteria bacterium]|nr:putative transrane protein [Betaproteobacteria bacterium]